jgi:predicted RNase H-like nuclease (RuvC/YqgF family)
MNVYSPTGKKIENWPQWVQRLVDENKKLYDRINELRAENLQLKARCRDQ